MLIECAVYTDGTRVPGTPSLDEAMRAAGKDGRFSWIRLHEPSTQEFARVAEAFDLHHLAVEDAVRAHQRPKLERYDDTLFMVLKPARWLDDREELLLGEVHVFIGDGFAVTVRHGGIPDLGVAQRRLENDPQRLALGPAAVLHAVTDEVVDEYMPIAAALEGVVDEIEHDVFSPDDLTPTERIYSLKREVLDFQRAAKSLSAAMVELPRGRLPHIDEPLQAYMRDVVDHTRHVVERIEAMQELLDAVLDANLTLVSVRLNNDQRRMSAWAAIALVPTVVGGIYGMNFQFMPELDWRYAYPTVLGVIAAICLTLYRAFRRNDWL